MKYKLWAFFCIKAACCFGSDSFEKMSLEEKVGQILMVHFHGEVINENAKTQSAASADPQERWDTLEHRELAQKIAFLALQAKDRGGDKISPLSDQNIFIVAPTVLKTSLQNTSLFKIGKSVDSYFFSHLNPSIDEVEAVKRQAETADVTIVCSYNAWKNPSAMAMTQSLLGTTKPVIILSLRDPLDTSIFSDADRVFTSFSPTVPSIQAICDQLTERYE